MSNEKEVVVVDYGIGNIFSVKQAFEKVGSSVIVSSDPEVVKQSKYLVLPGVGAFGRAMNALNDLNLIEAIQFAANQKTPLLGICLGMQMLLDESVEMGLHKGLGLIGGRVEKYPQLSAEDENIKIPQINWHELVSVNPVECWKCSILNDYKSTDAVYFVHSFVARPENKNNILASYISGTKKIPALIKNNNVIGCQFHPEKSGEVGLKMLKNFIKT